MWNKHLIVLAIVCSLNIWGQSKIGINNKGAGSIIKVEVADPTNPTTPSTQSVSIKLNNGTFKTLCFETTGQLTPYANSVNIKNQKTGRFHQSVACSKVNVAANSGSPPSSNVGTSSLPKNSVPSCGNNNVDQGEQCDSNTLALAGNQCLSFYGAAAPSGFEYVCSSCVCNTQVSTSSPPPPPPPPFCPNDSIDSGEQCDGIASGGAVASCTSIFGPPAAGSTYICTNCMCQSQPIANGGTKCGNNVLEGSEQCDGAAAGGVGASCSSSFGAPAAGTSYICTNCQCQSQVNACVQSHPCSQGYKWSQSACACVCPPPLVETGPGVCLLPSSQPAANQFTPGGVIYVNPPVTVEPCTGDPNCAGEPNTNNPPTLTPNTVAPSLNHNNF